jgi:hypothetical protein
MLFKNGHPYKCMYAHTIPLRTPMRDRTGWLEIYEVSTNVSVLTIEHV